MNLEFVIKLIFAFQAHFEAKWVVILKLEETEEAAQVAKIVANSIAKTSTVVYVSSFDMNDFIHVCRFQFLHESAMVLPLHPESGDHSRQLSFWDKITLYMPHFVWIFITDDTDYFSSIYVPMDCQFFLISKKEDRYEIFEIFRTDANSTLHRSEFGIWNDKSGLDVDQSNLDYRRNNFSGHELLVYHEKNVPIDWFSTTAAWVYRESMLNIGERLSAKIVFTTEESDDYEVSIVPNRIFPGQSLAPIFIFRYDLYYRVSSRTFSWTTYLSPFTLHFWFGIILTTACWYICLICVYKLFSYVRKSPTKKPEKGASVFKLINIDTEGGKSPSYYSAIIIYTVQIIGRIILSNAYSAIFMSFVIVFIHKPPFTDLAGILENGEYKILAIPSRSFVFYQLYQEDAIVGGLYEKHVIPEEQQVHEYEEAFELLCYSGEKYLTDFPAKIIKEMKFRMKGCIISETSIKLIYGEGSWVSKRNSTYRRAINYWSHRLVEAGTMDPIIWSRSNSLREFNMKNFIRAVDMYDSALLFIILAIGQCVSIFLLKTEILRSHKLTKKLYKKIRLIVMIKKWRGQPFQM